MKVSSRKAKGRNLQNLVRLLILKAFPELHPNDVKTAIMGETGVDIHLSEKALQSFPYAVECKNQEASKMLYTWFKQAVSNSSLQCRGDSNTAEAHATKSQEPVLFVKKNREKPLVIMDADHFFKLVRKGTLAHDDIDTSKSSLDDNPSDL